MVDDQQYIKSLTLKYRGARKLFVETGTATGGMTRWAADNFDRVITIEFDDDLHESAKRLSEGYTNITFVHGDSAFHLPRVLNEDVDESAVFFLDAHYTHGPTDVMAPTGETPIAIELAETLKHRQDHVVLVDDARLFTGTPYPTVLAVRHLAESLGYSCHVEDDVIVLLPGATNG